ncbi:MAG: hypothetical protein JWP71_2341, partial [Mucilaginibacter sp.]|nr:hypothetical protein [Mucilaginibacter sp.]
FETNSVNNNTILTLATDFKLTRMYGNGAPDLTPAFGSPALSGVDFTGPDFTNSFFSKVSYRGALGSSNWAAQSNWADWR